MLFWHLITGEYPPQPGGVSDYTRIIACELAAAGDEVHVWCPNAAGAIPQDSGVSVHGNLGRLSPADLRSCGKRLNQFSRPRRLLVQWVPHAYGYKSLNVMFCLWLWQRVRLHGDRIELMVHEPFLPFNRSAWKQNLAAVIHRLMILILLNCVDRVWLSIPGWEPMLAPYAIGRKLSFTWLPIPSNITDVHQDSIAESIRRRYAAENQTLLGHFGTYGRVITDMLDPVLPALLRERNDLSVLLMGRRSEAYRDELAAKHSDIALRLFATGGLETDELSNCISACDAMLQPYPDGISSRRTSAMVSLAHGKPLITTSGELTEPIWAMNEAVMLAAAGDAESLIRQSIRLLEDLNQRQRLGTAARRFYEESFDVRHIIARLRQTESENETVSEAEPVYTP